MAHGKCHYHRTSNREPDFEPTTISAYRFSRLFDRAGRDALFSWAVAGRESQFTAMLDGPRPFEQGQIQRRLHTYESGLCGNAPLSRRDKRLASKADSCNLCGPPSFPHLTEWPMVLCLSRQYRCETGTGDCRARFIQIRLQRRSGHFGPGIFCSRPRLIFLLR